MNGQIGLFDYMPTLQKEPEVGEWVDTSGNDLKRALGHPELQKERELPNYGADMKGGKHG